MTVAQLLELHPWPAAWADHKRIERLWIYELPASPEALWPHISDTSRMNRALGTAEMTFTEKAGKRFGTAKPGGVRHEWLEEPWNWVANQWLTSLRVYERGFFRAVWAIHHLEPIEPPRPSAALLAGSESRLAIEPHRHSAALLAGSESRLAIGTGGTGTRLYLYFGAIARSTIAAAAIRLGFPSIKRAYDRVLPALAGQLDRLRPEVLVLPAPALLDAAAERLRTQRAALIARGLDRSCVDALLDWIRTGDDADLHRIQIRERARVWKLPESELLRVALHATRAGLLALSWDTVCPHCRGVREANASLSDLKATSHCDACQLTFGTDSQEAVEVTFRVHPSIRDVPEVLYCSAEPAKKDHIRVQWTLPPAGKVAIAPKLGPGRYTMWRGHEGGWYLDVDDDGQRRVAWQPYPEGTVVKATPDATIELHNEASDDSVFTIEAAKWSDHALRAGQVLAFQEFRDLFSEEYIGADVRLAVGEQTLLFTDVVGSTAFYALRGDPVAFVEIKRHFDEVFAIVKECGGAVVKTIGDAVMATFGDPVDSLRAAKKIHDAFHPGRADTPIRLRISINTGPCIAVRLNANADFFGGTVNVAAKLQALAEGYQIAFSEATYRAPGVAAYLAEQSAALEDLEYMSKALPAPVKVKRWTLYRE